jgi:putative transposase
VRDRVELVDQKHPEISMRKQCELLGMARSTVSYKAADEDPEDIRIKRPLDEIYHAFRTRFMENFYIS